MAAEPHDHHGKGCDRPSLPERPGLFERLNTLNVTVIIFILAVIFSWPALRGSGRELDYAGNLHRFMTRFWPPDFSDWPKILEGLGQTIQIAVLATLFATLLSIPLSVLASRNIAPLWVVRCVRTLFNVIRSIPSLIWALLAVAIVGANALAGVIALTFYSMAYLGKFFSDAFESTDPRVADGLRVTGAGFIQRFQFGVWPHAKPLIWSHTLWMIEYNIRSAAIIGYVGAGGIGVYLHTYTEFAMWNKFAAVLCFILVIVMTLDFVGEKIRHELTKHLSESSTAEEPK
ncbi:phosphonate ABC transporter, permease protein PhnE [Oscillatoria laete-virens NRMC-F 0139]|nr:phosphonate ABC transporter, permease protein PhnE [Oscillatoria laete-virens]MDL5053571.1 phosphonate ABC transporter, permease protein PhnE [Oscillatoria laete-virens NRMC-F 0139]